MTKQLQKSLPDYLNETNASTHEKSASTTCASLPQPKNISPAQLRAARALLDWSRTELATESGLSSETIKNIEHGNFFPQETTCAKIIETFSARGVEFISFRLINVFGVVLASDKDGGLS